MEGHIKGVCWQKLKQFYNKQTEMSTVERNAQDK
jgi:hypothetical protein